MLTWLIESRTDERAAKLAGSYCHQNAAPRLPRKRQSRGGGRKPVTATHRGNFKDEFGVDVECYVLGDAVKTAVISQRGMARALGFGSGGRAFPRFSGIEGDGGRPWC